MKILNDTLTAARNASTIEDPDEYHYENLSSHSLDGKQFYNLFKISQSNPNVQPQQIYLAKRLGLVAFVNKDTLWVRD